MSKIDEIKQIILVRNDLGMGKGKIATQASHASVKASFMAYNGDITAISQIPNCPIREQLNSLLLENAKEWKTWFITWDTTLYKKIVLKANSVDELISVARTAYEAILPVFLVKDAGLTQIAADTFTACAIGPAPSSKIDPITRNLKLLN